MTKICIYWTLFFLFLVVLIYFASSIDVIAKVQIWRGYIIDKKCADSVKDDSNPKSFVEQHTADCLLMCKGKGYSLYSQGKWFDLDQKGNQLVLKLLRQSKKARSFYVEITAEVKDKILAVQDVKELTEHKNNNGENQHGAE
jgi:hypothetical protein